MMPGTDALPREINLDPALIVSVVQFKCATCSEEVANLYIHFRICADASNLSWEVGYRVFWLSKKWGRYVTCHECMSCVLASAPMKGTAVQSE